MCPFVTRPQNFPALLQLLPACEDEDQLTFLRETNELVDKAQFNATVLRDRSFQSQSPNHETDVITLLLSLAINMPRVSYGATELLGEIYKLLAKLVQPSSATRRHYEYVYQIVGSLAACSNSKDQMQSHFQVFAVCLELLHIFARPVVPSAACFYFLPEDSKMSVEIPPRLVWPFRSVPSPELRM